MAWSYASFFKDSRHIEMKWSIEAGYSAVAPERKTVTHITIAAGRKRVVFVRKKHACMHRGDCMTISFQIVIRARLCHHDV